MFERSHVEILIQYLKIVFIISYSASPDEMQHYAAEGPEQIYDLVNRES